MESNARQGNLIPKEDLRVANQGAIAYTEPSGQSKSILRLVSLFSQLIFKTYKKAWAFAAMESFAKVVPQSCTARR